MTEPRKFLRPRYDTWAFVLDQIEIDAPLPYEFAPGCSIDKATDEQITRIHATIRDTVAEAYRNNPEDLYESGFVTVQTKQGTKTQHRQLPKSEWRYYVVTSPGTGIINQDLYQASIISATPLEISAMRFYDHPDQQSQYYFPPKLSSHFYLTSPAVPRRVTLQDLDEIARIFHALLEAKMGSSDISDFPEIQRAMQMFNSLTAMGAGSEFQVLGLFSIIEMLITHNPKLEDRGDSITHQMQAKIPLLSHRFDRALDHGVFFQNTDVKKIWSQLYAYRSALAHGGVPDFTKKEMSLLKDSQNAIAFLREATKALLRHSIKEPQLYRDLRNC